MSERHHLAANLKRLRLPGILMNLDMRIQEARDNDLSYLEYLGLVIEDEIMQRENNILRKRIKAARFGNEKTLEAYDFKFNEDAIAGRVVRELATCRFVDVRENVVIVGPPGIGKTHIAKALGQEACRRGNNVLFKKAHRLFSELLNTDSYGRYEKLLRRCVKMDLLILDDFGFRRLETKEAELFYTLVDERLGNGSTIVTSNRPPQDWINIFPDMVMGGAILDRLVSGAHKIIVTKGKSYRKERSSVRNRSLDTVVKKGYDEKRK